MVARRRVGWADQGTRTLDEVIAFIANDSLVDAQRVLQRALDSASSLATLSERGRIVPELRDPTILELFVYRHRLIYEVGASRVTGAREFSSWRERIERSLSSTPCLVNIGDLEEIDQDYFAEE